MKRVVVIAVSCILLVIEGLVVLQPVFAAQRGELFDDIPIPARMAECITRLEPSVGAVQEQALKYARMTPADLTRWKKNIKLSALLPRLQFGYERKVTDGFDIDLEDNVSVTSSKSVVGPTTSGWGQDYDRNNNIEVTAVWYLDELLFNRDDLTISSEVRSQISARRNLLGEIVDDYFELKRFLSLYLMNGGETEKIRGRLIMEIDRLVGKLDILTGGWFGSVFRWKGVRCG